MAWRLESILMVILEVVNLSGLIFFIWRTLISILYFLWQTRHWWNLLEWSDTLMINHSSNFFFPVDHHLNLFLELLWDSISRKLLAVCDQAILELVFFFRWRKGCLFIFLFIMELLFLEPAGTSLFNCRKPLSMAGPPNLFNLVLQSSFFFVSKFCAFHEIPRLLGL